MKNKSSKFWDCIHLIFGVAFISLGLTALDNIRYTGYILLVLGIINLSTYVYFSED